MDALRHDRLCIHFQRLQPLARQARQIGQVLAFAMGPEQAVRALIVPNKRGSHLGTHLKRLRPDARPQPHQCFIGYIFNS